MLRLVALLALLVAYAPAESRVWTAGKFSTKGALVEFQGGMVYLRKDDTKRIVPVPLNRLAKADQEYVHSKSPDVSTLSGRVILIADGDTLTLVDSSNKTHKVRLQGIDAPEGEQRFGKESKVGLSDAVYHKTVTLEITGTDKYGRTLAHVFITDKWLNLELIKKGLAWHYKEYSNSEVLADAERHARAEKVGLWADASPVEPWVYRTLPSPSAPARIQPLVGSVDEEPNPFADPPPQPATAPGKAERTAAPEPEPEDKEETVYVTKTGAKYHRSGCSHLRKSSIPISLSEAKERYSACSHCDPPTASTRSR